MSYIRDFPLHNYNIQQRYCILYLDVICKSHDQCFVSMEHTRSEF